jgi:hypothetical protein
MIASYSASVVNFYNATGSLVRFINKNTFFLYSKNALAYYNVAVNLKVIGLAPGFRIFFLHNMNLMAYASINWF